MDSSNLLRGSLGALAPSVIFDALEQRYAHCVCHHSSRPGVDHVIRFQWVRAGGDRSTLMHAAFNASSRFVAPFLGDTRTRSHPSAEALTARAFLLLGSALAITTRGRLIKEAS